MHQCAARDCLLAVHAHTSKHAAKRLTRTHYYLLCTFAQVHASMRGIVSLAKETNQLELGRDASGGCYSSMYISAHVAFTFFTVTADGMH